MPLTSIKVVSVPYTIASVLNEILGLFTIKENIPETGLNELLISSWSIEDPLDEEVLQQVFDLCPNLKRLTLSWMCLLPDAVRMQLALKVAGILANSTQLRLLNLLAFSGENDSGEGQVVLESLCNSPCLD